MCGGTSIHESANFLNNECFSQKKFNEKKFVDIETKQQDVSNDVSTSYDTSKYCHKTCFSCCKTAHISRLCIEKRPQKSKGGLSDPK